MMYPDLGPYGLQVCNIALGFQCVLADEKAEGRCSEWWEKG